MEPEQVDGVELEALHLAGLGDHHRAGRRRIDVLRADVARLRDGGDVADEVPHRAARNAAREVRRELREPREVHQALRGLRRRREQPVAAHANALDQPADEDVRAHRLHRRRGRALELQERLDPVARLRPELRALERRLEGGDHVELAAARDRGHPGEIGRAQVDRRPGESAHDRGGVERVGQDAQPGEGVTHLGPLRRTTASPATRNGTLRSSSAAATRRPWRQPAAAMTQIRSGRVSPAASSALDLASRRLGLCALPLAAPEPNRRVAGGGRLHRLADEGAHGGVDLRPRPSRAVQLDLGRAGEGLAKPVERALRRAPEAADRLASVVACRDRVARCRSAPRGAGCAPARRPRARRP